MRNAVMLMLAAAICLACTREKPKPQQPPFNKVQFMTRGLQTLLSDIDLGATAAKKGRASETRAFAQAFGNDARQMLAGLTAIARAKNVTVPMAVDETKAALKDNLASLPGQVFDRGYLLAMLQDIRWMYAQLDRAAEEDRELASFADKWKPVLAKHEKEAKRVLDREGGSPFGFEP